MRTRQKLKIGISSCLLGNNVRYDGGNKLDEQLRDTLGQYAEWVPVCPEVECGLLVPREAMNLVGNRESTRLVTITSGIDHTGRMLRWLQEKLANLEKLRLCGFVLKARSPSCGIRDAQIVSPAGAAVSGPGLFASALMKRFPALPLEDEGGLQDPASIQRFLARISAYR